MAKTKKAKTKVPAWVPKDRTEVVKAIEELGSAQRDRAALETLMNNEIGLVQARYNLLVVPVNERMEVLQTGIAIWSQAHRDELTDNGKVKTHDFGSGQVLWRLTPWSVTLRGVEEIIGRLKQLRLKKYLRQKVEVNKQALLDDREKMTGKVDGITFHQTEEFIIAPADLTIDPGS